jgi:hypothetical protein
MAPGLLAVMCGPQGFSPGGAGARFAQDAAAEVLPPGPVLAALTEAAVTDVTCLTDDQLIGVLQAARRQENRESWKKALVIAEFARRRTAEFEAARTQGVPVHCRPGQFPGEELAVELVAGPVQASHAIDDATDLATRLSAALAGMAAGLIDEARAGVIALHTRCLSVADAALADDILAALAPTLRVDQLSRKAAALEMKLNPEAVKARREQARRTRQRVEVFREESGNAAVAGREMDTGDALASKAHIHSLALRLRRAGIPGTLDQLRLRVFADLTAGRNPLDRLARQSAPAGPAAPEDPAAPPEAPAARQRPPSHGPADGRSPGRAPSSAGRSPDAPSPDVSTDQVEEQQGSPVAGHTGPLDYDHDDYAHDDYADDPDISAADGTPPAPAFARTSPPAPMPATINLVVHAGTLFGWDSTPTEAGGWGLLEPDETRTVVAAASSHPATRWCVTVIGGDGTALAHGCSPGQHRWTPGSQGSQGSQGTHGDQGSQPTQGNQGAHGCHTSTSPRDRAGPQSPTAPQAAQLSDFLRNLNLSFTPIVRGTCDHAQAEPGYTPSRKLKHLVRARTTTCDAPGCGAQAIHADLDHTTPHPAGPTDQCNLGPKCRRHHKVKQAPDWKVEQPEPGAIRWTLPSGRTHATTPTVYDVTRIAYDVTRTGYDVP